jgi:hypothetical protein
MGGVGRKTIIENIQVSYSGDDSYEWFGGNVNCKYLIAHRGWDDDFDTGVINAKGLSATQIIRQAAKTKPSSDWGTANVLNPDLLPDIYEDVEDPNLFEFENGEMQDDNLFTEKPKHRTDSLSGPVR